MTLIDQLGRSLDIPECPQRIVSIVPSQTELLVDLGMEAQIVGITNFCVHPPYLRNSKERIGGTKELDLNKIEELNPDFILANKEENTKEQILALSEKFPVYVSDVRTFEDAIEFINQISELCKRQKKAELLIKEINDGFRKLPMFDDERKIDAVYLIWNKPLMSISGDTFIGNMLKSIGLSNPFEDNKAHYPETTIEEIQKIKPQYLLLSSEPYPFKRKQVKEFEEALPDTKVLLVDGEMFSWYGSRMVYSAEYFINLFRTHNE